MVEINRVGRFRIRWTGACSASRSRWDPNEHGRGMDRCSIKLAHVGKRYRYGLLLRHPPALQLPQHPHQDRHGGEDGQELVRGGHRAVRALLRAAPRRRGRGRRLVLFEISLGSIAHSMHASLSCAACAVPDMFYLVLGKQPWQGWRSRW